jgi:hypothetical protein
MPALLAIPSRALPFAILISAGLALIGLAAALIWWWWTFDYVVVNGYMPWTEASVCLLRDSDICALAKALCIGSHPRAYANYQATAFWIGAALLSLSLWAHAVRRPPGGLD